MTSPKNRALAWQIMQAALQAVDPAEAVRNCLRLTANEMTVSHPQGNERIYNLDEFDRIFVVGGGKAGAPMAAAVTDILGDRLTGGLVIVKHGHTLADATPVGPIEIVEAGHPIPDQAGLQGAQQIIDLLQSTAEHDLVLCLISGGGSALMTAPILGVSLVDLQALTQVLLACGATINEINTIRKHISQLKGGQLARRASPGTVVSLILSDVVGDPLDVIASGPTVPDPTTFADAWSVLTHYGVVDELPTSITTHLTAGFNHELADTPKPGDSLFDRVQNVIVGSNRLAARAAAEAAERLGFDTILLTTFIEGEAREVGRVAAGLAKGLIRSEAMHPAGSLLSKPACLIFGGETTVTLRGDGKGGRNQEMALAAALSLAGWENVLIACLATDGTDGPTDAAGAFADGTTVTRAAELGLAAETYLIGNDAYHFFEPLGDLIMTGPTKTNVNDLTLVLVDD
jgi:glycerate 2-kinase